MGVIPVLSAKRRSILQYFSRCRNIKHLGIRPTDLVLDLASGQDPQPRANILCDKFVTDSRERACEGRVVVDRPFVIADATKTPFPTGAFDFVYCSHLLEHMQQPGRLLDELQRIGRRGYIETPSKVYEKLWGWPFHRWFVTLEGDRLLLEAKDRVVFDDDLHEWFSVQIERKPVWEFFMSRLRDLELLTALVWDGKILYEIHGQSSPDSASFVEAQLDQQNTLSGIASTLSKSQLTQTQQVRKALGRWVRRHSDSRVNEVLNELICPQCHSQLLRSDSQWNCHVCDAAYPVVDNAPVMLFELAQPSADSAPHIYGVA